MVFTVLSGAPEGFYSDSIFKAGKKAFIYILSTNKLVLQDAGASISQQRIGSFVQDNGGFREFLDAYAENSSLTHVQVCILLLIICEYYLISIILKNNIWKSAVF
jgi:hypothetical protein